MIRVHFKDVGRNKLSWSVDLQTTVAYSESILIREIKKKKALMSSDIEVFEGTIFAGFRAVGKVSFEEIPDA